MLFVEPLLQALNWHGNRRDLLEAIPRYLEELNLNAFHEIMRNLNYEHHSIKLRLTEIDEKILPCLAVTEKGLSYLILKNKTGEIIVFDGIEVFPISNFYLNIRAEIYFYSKIKAEKNSESAGQAVTVFSVIKNIVKPFFLRILMIGLVVNLLSLSLPLFIIGVYDKVIAIGSYNLLLEFLLGIVIALVFSSILSILRAGFYAYISAKLDKTMNKLIFEKIIKLPAKNIESSSISTQLSRIKDFESLRDFFTNTFFTLIFELPFLLIILLALGMIGGSIVLVPLVALLIFFILGLLAKIFSHKFVLNAAHKNSKLQEFLIEFLENIRTIKHCSGEGKWQERHREYFAESTIANRNAALISAIINSLADAYLLLASAILVVYGTYLAINAEISVGYLIASVMLTWRILSPAKHIFTMITRYEQIDVSIKQINKLLAIKSEINTDYHTKPNLHLSGQITFNRLSFTYKKELNAALYNVNLEINPGSFIVFAGSNGSGKSTLFKLLLKLYSPQAGNVYLDGIDLRQIHPTQLRQAISYVPQSNQYIVDTIRNNLLYINPYINEKDLYTAISDANLYNDIMALPNQLDTLINESYFRKLPTSFWRRFALARAYLKQSNIILLDEPLSTLDQESNYMFNKKLQTLLNENKTILMSTHKLEYMEKAHRLIVLEKGQIILDGDPKTILPEYLIRMID